MRGKQCQRQPGLTTEMRETWKIYFRTQGKYISRDTKEAFLFALYTQFPSIPLLYLKSTYHVWIIERRHVCDDDYVCQ